MLTTLPYLESRYQSYIELKEERERIKGLTNRVKEQERLIQMMEKQNVLLVDNITDYLASGGLFNPDLINHERVRDMLIEMRRTITGDAK